MSFSLRIPAAIDGLAEQGWVVLDDFLSPAESQALLDSGMARRQAGEFKRAAVGRGQGQAIRDDIRGDSVLWLNQLTAQAAELPYWERIEALRLQLNQQLYLGLRRGEYHYAHYPLGAGYQRHLDRFRDDDARTVSAVCYLNPDWQEDDGGQLRLWLGEDVQSPYLDFTPQAGRLLLFLSDRFWHAVLPAKRERWSVTGWMRRDEAV